MSATAIESDVVALAGLPVVAASRIAERVMGHLADLRSGKVLGGACDAREAGVEYSAIQECLTEGRRVVVALPLTLTACAALRWLHSLHGDVVVERTEESSSLLRHLLPRRCQLTASQLIDRAKNERPPSVFVTFPDHREAAEGTSMLVEFFGRRRELSLLEPLLVMRTSAVLFTLVVSPKGWRLAPYPGSDMGTIPAARSALTWLAARMQEVVLAAPDELVSWGHLSRRRRLGLDAESAFAQAAYAYLYLWQETERALADELFRSMTHELRKTARGGHR